MSHHEVRVVWTNKSEDFSYPVYDRTHTWISGGGTTIVASSAAEFKGNPGLINPEEALVAALSSCHMLTFLAIASRKRLVVESYEDHAIGYLDKNKQGRLAITQVKLRPKIIFRYPDNPSPETISGMHHLSHLECFIANSVLTEVIIEEQ